jgi:hypothetical protein
MWWVIFLVWTTELKILRCKKTRVQIFVKELLTLTLTKIDYFDFHNLKKNSKLTCNKLLFDILK